MFFSQAISDLLSAVAFCVSFLSSWLRYLPPRQYCTKCRCQNGFLSFPVAFFPLAHVPRGICRRNAQSSQTSIFNSVLFHCTLTIVRRLVIKSRYFRRNFWHPIKNYGRFSWALFYFEEKRLWKPGKVDWRRNLYCGQEKKLDSKIFDAADYPTNLTTYHVLNYVKSTSFSSQFWSRSFHDAFLFDYQTCLLLFNSTLILNLLCLLIEVG